MNFEEQIRFLQYKIKEMEARLDEQSRQLADVMPVMGTAILKSEALLHILNGSHIVSLDQIQSKMIEIGNAARNGDTKFLGMK